ncbi:hypothetical protein E2542_SST11591 [Spatholobus suberectus]|nr:hypothetical protein E2542_SST11591 [Spatholobus suberectus]
MMGIENEIRRGQYSQFPEKQPQLCISEVETAIAKLERKGSLSAPLRASSPAFISNINPFVAEQHRLLRVTGGGKDGDNNNSRGRGRLEKREGAHVKQSTAPHRTTFPWIRFAPTASLL